MALQFWTQQAEVSAVIVSLLLLCLLSVDFQMSLMSLICPQLVYIPGFSFAATLTEKMDWEELKVISNSVLHNLTWIQCLLGLLGQISIRLISIRLLFFYSCLSGWDCSTFNSYKHACYHNEVSKPGSLPWWKHTSLKWQKLLSKTAVCTFLLWTHLARFPSTPSFSCSPLPQSNFPAAISYKDSPITSFPFNYFWAAAAVFLTV